MYAAERRINDTQVTDMIQKGLIRKSWSSWALPVVQVKKKCGTIRFSVDYRGLNKVTRKYVYPLPRIDDTLDSLQGSKFFSSIDVRSSYWQITITLNDKEKAAFTTPDGLRI